MAESTTARRDDQGHIVRYVAHIRDATARIRAEQELAESARLFRDVLENVDLAALNMDANGTITYCNPELCRLVGWPAEELLGRDWFEICVPPDDGEARALHGEGIATGRIERHHEGHIRTRSGERRTMRWSHTLVTNPSGRPVGTTSLGEDITEKMAAQRALAHRATHDPLTGLANRTLLDERLAQALADATRPVAVIVCDLDGFKRVNDRLGHAAGDEVLRAVSGRLRGVCRAQDLVCRPAGDEFVIVITGEPGETARHLRRTCTQVAERIGRAVRQPVGWTAAAPRSASRWEWRPRPGRAGARSTSCARPTGPCTARRARAPTSGNGAYAARVAGGCSSPSCLRTPSRSGTPQWATIRPSTTRTTSNTSARNRRPVGGWPMKGPSCVPVATSRAHAVSPATVRSWISRWKSENARLSDAITARTPSAPGAWFGPKS